MIVCFSLNAQIGLFPVECFCGMFFLYLFYSCSHTFSLKHRGYVAGIQEASLQVELKCMILELIRKVENDGAIGTFAQRFH